MYLICFFPGALGTGAAFMLSTRKQQFEQPVQEFSVPETAGFNQFGSSEEFD